MKHLFYETHFEERMTEEQLHSGVSQEAHERAAKNIPKNMPKQDHRDLPF